jgi:phospholipid transport system transporter-binding protein
MKPTDTLKLEYRQGGELSLEGALTLATVTGAYQQSIRYFQGGEGPIPQTINLSSVSCMDSAGLALMIEWLRLGKQQNTDIVFQNVPAQITPLVKLFGIDNLLH